MSGTQEGPSRGRKPSTPGTKVGIWGKTHKIELIDAENHILYTETARIVGKLMYILTDFNHKEPLSQAHYDHEGTLIHLEEPQIYNGKFGPGVIIL